MELRGAVAAEPLLGPPRCRSLLAISSKWDLYDVLRISDRVSNIIFCISVRRLLGVQGV